MTKHFVACSFIQAAGKGCAVHSHLASHSVHMKIAKQFATKLVLTFPDIAPPPPDLCVLRLFRQRFSAEYSVWMFG